MLKHALLAGAFAAIVAGPATAADAPNAAPAPSTSAEISEPLDYSTLTHVLAIDSLRAGSHDESGRNAYFFNVTMYGLLNSAEERNLEFAKRKKLVVELGKFGETQIDSLALWRPDDKGKNVKELRINGGQIRELAARTMNEFKAQEGEVAIEVEIVMMKRNKRFVFFGDDQRLAATAYYPIPPTKFDSPLRANQMLTITDDKGTLVKLAVRYDKPAAAANAAPAAEKKPQ